MKPTPDEIATWRYVRIVENLAKQLTAVIAENRMLRRRLQTLEERDAPERTSPERAH